MRTDAPNPENPRRLPPKIKLCGQTRLEDVRFSFENGADYCGVVINVPSSPRTITVEKALPIFNEFRGRLFALTANTDAKNYSEIAGILKPAFFQLTADEPADEVKSVLERFGVPVFKSIHLPAPGEAAPGQTAARFLEIMESYLDAGCEGFVLDVKSKGMYGGTGRASDWDLAGEIIKNSKSKILLAGGLTPENISKAVKIGSYGLDLASGVETSPGIKSREKITRLFSEIRRSIGS